MNKLKYHKIIDLIDEDIIKEAEIKTPELLDTESGNTADVTGVERYRGIAWHRITAAVSAVLLIAGIGAGGALMLKKRPPLLVESVDTTAEDPTERPEFNAGGSNKQNSSSEKTEAATDRTSEAKQKGTKESNDISLPAGAENNDNEEPTAAPQENNEPEERENVTTAVNTTQLPILRTTVTKEQTTQKPTTVTTKAPVVQQETEPVTERATPENKPGYIPYLAWYPEDGDWLMNTLSGLAYTPWSYDVAVGGRPPEGYINGSDGNAYALCFSERWVRRNWCEQAYMPDEIFNYFDGSSHVYYPHD